MYLAQDNCLRWTAQSKKDCCVRKGQVKEISEMDDIGWRWVCKVCFRPVTRVLRCSEEPSHTTLGINHQYMPQEFYIKAQALDTHKKYFLFFTMSIWKWQINFPNCFLSFPLLIFKFHFNPIQSNDHTSFVK